MEQPDEIIDLNKVFIKNPNQTLVNYTSSYLTAPGENYGSIMLALEIQLQDNTRKNETVHAVAKLVPKNEFIRNIFQPQITFKKELEMYRTIAPIMTSFQKNNGIDDVLDLFPKFCGGRLGLENIDEFGTNPVILLENLKMSGYEIVDRLVRFNFETAKFVLRELARFHSVGIAIKLKQPTIFKEIKKTMTHFDPLKTIDDSVIEQMQRDLFKILEEDDECRKYLNQYKIAFKKSLQFYQNPIITRETFTTLTHSDFWINNILIKFIDGKPEKIKFIDFQLSDYGSVSKDILLLLYCNLQCDVLLNHFDDLVHEYHKSLISVLEQFHIDTDEFSMEALMAELEWGVKEHSLFHCSMMFQPICAEVEDSRNVEELSEEFFKESRPIPLRQKEMEILMVKDLVERNWL